MLFILNSHVWTATIFFTLIYSVFLISFILYVIPIFSSNQKYNFFKTKTQFLIINWTSIYYFLISFILSIFILTCYWYNSCLSVWFGHLIIYNFNFKMIYINLIFLTLVLYTITSNSYFSSKEIYDFVITILNAFFWLSLIFFVNSIFSTIFIIEVLSTIIFLLIITSNYSTTFYYNTTDLSKGSYTQQVFPNAYLQELLFFFWVSLLASLNLFLFVTLLYLRVFSFDWFLIEHVFNYFLVSNSFWDITSVTIPWFIFIFSVFLKCGLVPFFFWKPVFFKGLSIHMLFTYICYFYFYFFLFIIHLISTYFSELYYYYLFIMVIILTVSLLLLLTILCESYYIKIFLAMSSILNSVLVFIGLSSLHHLDFLLVL
jgi:hypothetical protein